MTIHQLNRVANMRLEELHKERWAIAQVPSGRPQIVRSLAAGLRRVADALDGDRRPQYAPAR
jgi:hypothetical protein